MYSDWHDGPAKEQMYRLNAVKGKNYKVVLEYFQAGGEASLKFDIGIKKEINYKEVADKAAEADAIIFVGGLSPTLEGEEMPVDLPGFRKGDRTNIDLPHVQTEMLKALKRQVNRLFSYYAPAVHWRYLGRLRIWTQSWKHGIPVSKGEQLWPMSCLATIILPDVYRLPSMLRAMISPILRTMT